MIVVVQWYRSKSPLQIIVLTLIKIIDHYSEPYDEVRL